MNKKLAMIFARQILAAGTAMAQSQFTGKVVSADDGEPVVGATVRVAGTNAATITDIDGNFTLAVRKRKAVEHFVCGHGRQDSAH